MRMVSREACAPVKCAGGAAILTIEWLDGDHRHAPTLYRNLRVGTRSLRRVRVLGEDAVDLDNHLADGC